MGCNSQIKNTLNKPHKTKFFYFFLNYFSNFVRILLKLQINNIKNESIKDMKIKKNIVKRVIRKDISIYFSYRNTLIVLGLDSLLNPAPNREKQI